jgi:hypothetical protein
MDESSSARPDESASGVLPAGGVTQTPPRRPIREDRAVRLFLLLGVIGLLALLFGLAGSTDVSMLERVVRSIPALAWVVGLFVAASGLVARRAWAVASLKIILGLLIAGGVVSAITAIGHGQLFVPLGALLAAWVLRAPPSASVAPRVGPGGAALVSVFVLASVGPWLADSALAPGGPLSVSAADIVPALTVNCGEPGHGVPENVTAAFDWSWRRTEALTDGTDMVAVGWTGQDDAGTDLFILGDASSAAPEPGIWQGGGSPSQTLADQFEGRFHSFNGWTWGVNLGEQRMDRGHVPFTMRRVSGEPVAHGQLTVQAAYVHLGRWINDDAIATCSW